MVNVPPCAMFFGLTSKALKVGGVVSRAVTVFFFKCYGDFRYLPSFHTRRSSDLYVPAAEIVAVKMLDRPLPECKFVLMLAHVPGVPPLSGARHSSARCKPDPPLSEIE